MDTHQFKIVLCVKNKYNSSVLSLIDRRPLATPYYRKNNQLNMSFVINQVHNWLGP